MKLLLLSTALLTASVFADDSQWITYPGGEGPGKGKHIVLLSGDEEYRSEEVMPQLAKILSQRHGFKTTVLFSINKQTGEIDPKTNDNEPGTEALATADACILLLRFRAWPDAQMKAFDEYYKSGKPFIALRTSTHAFNFPKGSTYDRYTWNRSEPWKGGFGRFVLGETWVAHHGAHKKEATRGIIADDAKDSPFLRGVTDLFGDTDVYTAAPPDDVKVLVRGQVLKGMNPTDDPVEGKKNDPMQPVVWYREHANEAGKTNRVLCTTMGSATDLKNDGLRRLVVNATYIFSGLEAPASADVGLVGEFQATMYGFDGFRKGLKPADLK